MTSSPLCVNPVCLKGYTFIIKSYHYHCMNTNVSILAREQKLMENWFDSYLPPANLHRNAPIWKRWRCETVGISLTGVCPGFVCRVCVLTSGEPPWGDAQILMPVCLPINPWLWDSIKCHWTTGCEIWLAARLDFKLRMFLIYGSVLFELQVVNTVNLECVCL